MTAYRKGNVLAIALAHGKTDWVKNVLAAGQADLRFARHEVHLTNTRILPAGYDGPDVAGLPRLAKAQLGADGGFRRRYRLSAASSLR